MTKPLRLSPYLLLTLANLFWAGNWIISRAFHAELPPVALSFWRWLVSLLSLPPLSTAPGHVSAAAPNFSAVVATISPNCLTARGFGAATVG